MNYVMWFDLFILVYSFYLFKVGLYSYLIIFLFWMGICIKNCGVVIVLNFEFICK